MYVCGTASSRRIWVKLAVLEFGSIRIIMLVTNPRGILILVAEWIHFTLFVIILPNIN